MSKTTLPHPTWLILTRTLGGTALLVVGAVHYQQYHYEFYSAIPTIGPLFLLNFIAGTTLGLFLIAPFKSRLGHFRGLLEQLAALIGICVAAGGLAALLISEHTPLFGFMEHGYRFAIVLAIASDAAATVTLTLFLICARSRASEPQAALRRGPGGELDTRRPGAPAAEH